jgi:hypothetical protein
MLELKNNPSFHARAEAALRGRFQQFASEAQTVMAQAVVRLRQARGSYAQRVVVIADSLEKITHLRDEDREAVETSMETLFVSHARLLRLPCHVVYTFPLWLRYHRADLGANYDCEPLVLPMVKIAEPNGGHVAAGLDKLCELVARRVDVASVFGPDRGSTLLPLVHASGGYPRDLIRMVRTLLMESRIFPVRAEDTERVIAQLAEAYSNTILETDLEVLAEVAQTHGFPRRDREQVAAFARLLGRWLVLAYRNGSEWYDLHPLVRRARMVQAKLRSQSHPNG